MHKSKWTSRVALVASAAAMMTAGARAQSMTSGGISGTVFDATEAAVPDASVLIHSNGTGADLSVKAGSNGEFIAPLLQPGTYTVTITAPGFSTVKQTGVVVAVNQVTQLLPHLTTGEAVTAVEVTADQPVLQFDSPAFGGQLSNREIENIPINNRRWSSLALTTPGVTNDASGFGLISFRAIPAVLNNVQIDGIDDNQAFFGEERGRTRAGYSTSQVAVREFQVNTGVYSAELGRAVGGVVNSITKTGGNQFHGEVYFYHRGDEFSSINPKVTLNNLPFRPKDKRNQYGFGVGGPLIKDRLFWFYAFDAFRRNFPGVAVSGNPGVFNAPAVCTPALLAATGTNNAACTAAFNDLNGDLGLVPRFGNQLINTPKLTWQINNKNTLNVLFHRLRWDSPGGVQTQAALNYARDAFGTDFVKLDYGVAKLDSVFGSNLTNEVRYQYARELNDEGQQTPTDYTLNHLQSTGGNLTYASITTSAGGFNVGSPYYSYRVAYPDERKWQIGDTAAYLWRRHTIRFGADILHNYDLQNNLYQSNGSFSYASPTLFLADVLNPGRGCVAQTGSGTPALAGATTAAANRGGCFSSLNQGFGPTTFDLATLDQGYFVQDDWKLTPRLTLNLGVRYDYEALPAPYANAVAANLPQQANHPSDKNNVAPRVGFAWDPFGQGKTVVRGGFGMYYGRLPNGVLLNTYVATGTANAQTSVTAYNGTDIDPNTAGVQKLTFPNILTVRPAASANALVSTAYLDSHLQNPYTEQFDLAIQQDLGYRNVLSVSYLGALGRELPNYINTNLNPANSYTATYTIQPNTSAPGNCLIAACGTTFTQRVYSASTVNGTSNTVNRSYLGVSDVLSNANSNYHALSVDVTNRNWHWVTFDANYTWSHALDFNVGQFASVTAGSNNWIDPFANARSNYGNANINVRHRAVGWAIVNIPGVKSERSALSYIANGWSVKPLVQVQSGLPYSASISSGSAPRQCTAATCLQAWSSGVAGTGVSYIPFFGRNTLTQPRNIVVDARVQKDFRIREGASLQLLAEGFNLANHQNITGVNTGAFSLASTGGSATAPQTGLLTATTNFGQATSAGVNSNYAYQVRQLQLGVRVLF